MAGFSPRSVLGVGALCATLLLSACSAQQDAALQPPSPTSASSSASATNSASPSSATGSATPSASAEAPRSTSSAASEAPSPTAAQPTVVEQAPVTPSEPQQEASPEPTGTVTTVEPAQPSESARASEQASTPAQAANDACRLGQTVVSAEAKGGAGAAGSQYLTLTFTNTGSTPCTVSGYPAVSYVDDTGQTIGAPASLAAEWTSSAVTLEPGRSTTAILRETRADLFGDRCKPVTSSGYRVQLPQTTESLTIPYPSEGCSDTSIQQLSVGQVGASV